MMDYDIIGAIKIKDGLFLGDEYAAQDLEFIVTNKVTHVINCSAKQVPNHWEAVEVEYLSYGWLETDSQVIFDIKDEVLNATYNLIEETLDNAESVLVHSIRGQNRSVCIIAAYMMKKYRWTLYKTMEYIHSRRQDLEIKASFFNQLLSLENKLTRQGLGAKSYNWKQLSNTDQNNQNDDELLLTNTFLNAKIGIEDLEDNEHDNSSEQNDIEKEIEEEEINNQEDQKKEDKQDKGQEFDLKKPDEIEDFDLNSFDGDSDLDQIEQKNIKKKKDTKLEVKKIEKEEENSSKTQQTATEEKQKDLKIISAKESKQEKAKSKILNNDKIRKIVWTDEEGGSKTLCSLEIPPYDQCLFRKKLQPGGMVIATKTSKQSFYRSILKGSNKIFSLKQQQSKQQQQENGDINATSTSLNNSTTVGSGALRKIGSIKTTILKSKKPEDAIQEKRIIMQKISNNQKEISPLSLPLPNPLSQSEIPNLKSASHGEEESKEKNQLNSVANKQLKDVMAKYDQPQSINVEKGDDTDPDLGTSSKQIPTSVKDRRRNVRKDLQQTSSNDLLPNSTLGQVQIPQGRLGGGQYELIDDDFAYVSTKQNNIVGMNNAGNTTVGHKQTFGNFNKPVQTNNNNIAGQFGMSVSAKNFYYNQNAQPLPQSTSLTGPKFPIKNSFKNTQKIYSSSFGNSKQPQTNNFLFAQSLKNVPEIGFQIQKLGSKAYTSEEKKISKTAKVYSRPSTAPLKQNPYQRLLNGNQIKQNPNQLPSTQSSQQQFQLPLPPQPPSQSIPFQLLPVNQEYTHGLVRQNSQQQQQQKGDESGRKSLRSNSAGNNQTYNAYLPSRPPQFGFFSSNKSNPRWKF